MIGAVATEYRADAAMERGTHGVGRGTLCQKATKQS